MSDMMDDMMVCGANNCRSHELSMCDMYDHEKKEYSATLTICASNIDSFAISILIDTAVLDVNDASVPTS